MHKNATKCKWCKNKHGASKIIDTFEKYQRAGQIKNMTGGLNASRHCTRWLGGPNCDPFSVQTSMQMDQDEPFGCVGPLKMALGHEQWRQ
jgi:hypothetical protein